MAFRITNEDDVYNTVNHSDAVSVGVKYGKPFSVTWDAAPLWGWTEHYTADGKLISKEKWWL